MEPVKALAALHSNEELDLLADQIEVGHQPALRDRARRSFRLRVLQAFHRLCFSVSAFVMCSAPDVDLNP